LFSTRRSFVSRRPKPAARPASCSELTVPSFTYHWCISYHASVVKVPRPRRTGRRQSGRTLPHPRAVCQAHSPKQTGLFHFQAGAVSKRFRAWSGWAA